MKRIYFLIIIFSVVSGTAYSQYKIPLDVSGNVGGTTTGLENSALLLAGQNVIGKTSNSNNMVYLGLMAPLRYVITDVQINKNGIFQLFQNYPNPFSNHSTISFSISKESNIRLSVLNILGQDVSILVDRRMSAGRHDIEFIPTNLTPGIYFYEFKAGNFIETKKMILTK
jgi:hypothetical protein